MMNILNKINIHPLFYIVMFIMFIIGLFEIFTLFLFVIITHELGHITGALLMKWKIEKIILLPFGGLVIFNEDINRRIFEELVITLLGPIFQTIVLIICPKVSFISIPLLIFNLMPIYPMDGFKIINLIINKFCSFKRSYLISLYLSLILCLIFIFLNKNLLVTLSLLLMLYQTYKSYKNRKIYFNRFLLERHLKTFNLKKDKLIRGLNYHKMFRDYKHTFIIKNKWYSEREILENLFDFKGKVC